MEAEVALSSLDLASLRLETRFGPPAAEWAAAVCALWRAERRSKRTASMTSIGSIAEGIEEGAEGGEGGEEGGEGSEEGMEESAHADERGDGGRGDGGHGDGGGHGESGSFADRSGAEHGARGGARGGGDEAGEGSPARESHPYDGNSSAAGEGVAGTAGERGGGSSHEKGLGAEAAAVEDAGLGAAEAEWVLVEREFSGGLGLLLEDPQTGLLYARPACDGAPPRAVARLPSSSGAELDPVSLSSDRRRGDIFVQWDACLRAKRLKLRELFQAANANGSGVLERSEAWRPALSCASGSQRCEARRGDRGLGTDCGAALLSSRSAAEPEPGGSSPQATRSAPATAQCMRHAVCAARDGAAHCSASQTLSDEALSAGWLGGGPGG